MQYKYIQISRFSSLNYNRCIIMSRPTPLNYFKISKDSDKLIDSFRHYVFDLSYIVYLIASAT